VVRHYCWHRMHYCAILSSLFENLRNARDKTLVCKDRSEFFKTRETVLLTRRVDTRIEVVQCLGTFCTQPLEAMNWAEYYSRIFYVLTFPELIQYRICRISLHTITQISCVHAVLRVSILFFILTNQRISISGL
jgi:hypothetical protein